MKSVMMMMMRPFNYSPQDVPSFIAHTYYIYSQVYYYSQVHNSQMIQQGSLDQACLQTCLR